MLFSRYLSQKKNSALLCCSLVFLSLCFYVDLTNSAVMLCGVFFLSLCFFPFHSLPLLTHKHTQTLSLNNALFQCAHSLTYSHIQSHSHSPSHATTKKITKARLECLHSRSDNADCVAVQPSHRPDAFFPHPVTQALIKTITHFLLLLAFSLVLLFLLQKGFPLPDDLGQFSCRSLCVPYEPQSHLAPSVSE